MTLFLSHSSQPTPEKENPPNWSFDVAKKTLDADCTDSGKRKFNFLEAIFIMHCVRFKLYSSLLQS